MSKERGRPTRLEVGTVEFQTRGGAVKESFQGVEV